MKKLLLLPLFFLLFAACDDDDDCCEPPVEESFELIFKAKTQNGPFILTECFELQDGSSIMLNRLQFYISEVELLQGLDRIAIKDVDLVTFETHATQEAADEGFILTFDDVPTGNYDGIRFGLGVAPDLNAATPSYYAATEPESVLARGADYWSGWDSYVFTKVEGYYDANGNGLCEINAEEAITYHVGLDELYRATVLEAPVEISETGGGQLTITVDVDKIFSSIDNIDFAAEPIAHSNPLLPDNMATTTKIANNLTAALSIE